MFSSESWLSNQQPNFYNGVATQSLRFDSASSASLEKTFGTADDDDKLIFSFWAKRSTPSANHKMLVKYASTDNRFYIGFANNDKLYIYQKVGGTESFNLQTNRLFRDPSAWYHIVVAFDTTQGTDTNKIKLYVNGTEETSFSTSNYPIQNLDLYYQTATSVVAYIGEYDSSQYFDGYLAEVNLVDGLSFFSDTSGTPNPSFNINSFGELKNGVWIPKAYSGSYGTNGFRLQFNKTGTGTGSTTTVGADTSGNLNHWDTNAVDTEDCDMPDSPENNFATLNPLSFFTDNQLINGNLELPYQTTNHRANTGTMFMQTGKWYFEVYNTTSAASGLVAIGVGLQDISKLLSYASGDDNYVFYANNNNAKFYTDTSQITLGTGGTHVPTAGSIIQVAYDADTGNIFIGVNNTYIAEDGGSDGNPATGANPTKTLSTNIDYIPFVGVYNNIAIANFGQDSTFAGATTAGGNKDGNGKGDFKYSVPSGYLALCTANISDNDLPISPNSINGTADEYFGILTYTGNGTGSGSTNNIRSDDPGVGGKIDFKPDLTWIKSKSNTSNHILTDSTRLAGNVLFSNLTNDEADNTAFFTSFETNGFDLAQNGGDTNASGYTYVAWNWKANGGTTSSNTDGSIPSTVQANTDAGFSIVTYTGTRTSDAGETGTPTTIGHGLGKKPAVVITKARDTTTYANWNVWHQGYQPDQTYLNYQLWLNLPDGANNAGWQRTDTGFSTTTFCPARYAWDDVSGIDYVAYVFAEIDGYSKFGSFTGGGSTFPFVYTGFRPAFVMFKNVNATAAWIMQDTTRDPYNVATLALVASDNLNETTVAARPLDFVSNGFKLRTSAVDTNGSGNTIVYMAFAETPTKYSLAR